MISEEIKLDHMENSLVIKPGDCDGFHICESNDTNKIYVYYSEIENLEQLLRRVKYLRNTSVQHSSGSKEVSQSNAKELFKSIGNVKSFKAYDDYIQSMEWRDKVFKRKKKDGFKCRSCGSVHDLEVHHKRYDNLGKEDLVDDLVTLCRGCHEGVTRKARRKRKGVITEVD